MTDARQRVVEIAASCLGQGPECCAEAAPGYDLSRVSWCQIFWLHCIRQAGLTTRVWPSGPAWPTAWLPTTNDPQPGDMAYIHNPYQHGAVVESVGHDTVQTIDGNSVGGVVQRNIRPRSRFTSFYSIGQLLGTAVTMPAPQSWRDVQAALTGAGYDPGPLDGVVGPRTRAALERWALAHPERIVP